MNDHPRTVRHASGTNLIAALVLLSMLSACGVEPPESKYFREGNELSEWTSRWYAEDRGIHFRVDPDFEHEGGGWVDGIVRPGTVTVEFLKSNDDKLYLRFVAGDWASGHLVWIGQAGGDGDLELGTQTYSDLVIPLELLDPRGKDLCGRVLLSSFDWEPQTPVHCQFALRARDHDGQEYMLRGSGTAIPPVDEVAIEDAQWASFKVPESQGLQRLSSWTRDTTCYRKGVEVLVDPDYRCADPDWMEAPGAEGWPPGSAPLAYLTDPAPLMRMDDGEMSATEVLMSLDAEHEISVEVQRTLDFIPFDGEQLQIWQYPRGRLLISTPYWEYADEVHLEYQLVCGPLDDPFIVRGAGSVFLVD